MTRQERRKRRRQRRRRMQAGILLSLVFVLGLIIALRAGKERETLEPEIPLAAERQTLAYIAPAPALPDTAAEETPEEPEEPPVEPEQENRYAELHFSDEDVYILACLVYHEARGESFEGQVAVVEVVLNRMLSDYFPDTVEEVVFQKYGDVWQFSPAPYLYSAEPGKEQYLAVHTAIEEREYILSEDTVYFSTAPYNESVDMIIGNHYFCKIFWTEEKTMQLITTRNKEISFAELKKAISSGNGLELIRPRDKFAIELKNGELVNAVCGGYVNEKRARFALEDCLVERWRMNDAPTNKCGYLKSEGRRHVIEDILPLFPDELAEAFVPRFLSEEIDGERHEYADTIWIPSATDVFGAGNWWNEEPDSFQLEIFKRERDRVKEHVGDGTWFWWLRSPSASYSSDFVGVYNDGTVYYYIADYSLGFAPGFDL